MQLDITYLRRLTEQLRTSLLSRREVQLLTNTAGSSACQRARSCSIDSSMLDERWLFTILPTPRHISVLPAQCCEHAHTSTRAVGLHVCELLIILTYYLPRLLRTKVRGLRGDTARLRCLLYDCNSSDSWALQQKYYRQLA